MMAPVLRDTAATPLAIGPLVLDNPFMLAPMAGLTDAPMRWLARQCGAGYTVAEMISSKAELWDTQKSTLRRRRLVGEGPRAVQIAGYDPQQMAAAAKRVVSEGAEVVDLNFGCPAKKVCRKAAGSALLTQPALVAEIVAAVVAAVPTPVTVKMRTGPSPEQRNGVEIAELAAAVGASAIAVHGRTRACRFRGAVEYDTIRAIKARVSVPVIANGDIDSAAAAARVLALTGADGIMIGRAAIGAPWLFAELLGTTVPDEERWQLMIRHVALMRTFYGEALSVRLSRKHVAAYLPHLLPASRQVQSVRAYHGLTTAASQADCLARLRDRALLRRAA